MKKTLLIAVAILSMCLTGFVHGDHHDVQTIKVGLFPIEPVNFYDQDGKPSGLNPDLLKEIAKIDKAWKPEFVPVTWAEGLEKLQSEEIDLFISVSYTHERAQVMDYSNEPVMVTWGQVYTHPDSGIAGSLDLADQTVGIMRRDINGDNFKELMNLLGVECSYREFDTHDEIFEAVSAGEVAAGVTPSFWGQHNAEKYQLVGTSIRYSPIKSFFVTKKGKHADVLESIDRVMSEWKAENDSFYYDRLNYWLQPGKVVKKQTPMAILISVGGLVLCVILLGGLAWLLNHQVKLRTAALKASEEKLKEAHRIAQLGRWDMDFVTGRVEWSDALIQILEADKSDSERPYESIMDYIHPDDHELVDETFKKAVAEHTPYVLEHRIITGTGKERWVLELGEIEYDKAGNAVHAFGTAQDITERKVAETEIHVSRERLSLATKASHVGIWEYDFDKDLLIWDDLMFQMYDIAPENFMGNLDSWKKRVHPDDIEYASGQFESAFLTGGTFRAEFRVVWKDGTIRHIRAQCDFHQDENGNPVKAVGTNWDVTNERKMVSALKQSEEDYRKLFENMTTGFLMLETITDNGCPVDFRIIQTNRALDEIFSRKRAELIGNTLKQAVGGLEDYWYDVFCDVASTGKPTSYENRAAAINRVLSVWVFASKPGHLGVIVTDNSARRAAEDAVLDARQQLQHIVDNTQDVIFQVDLEGNYIYANSATLQLTGYTSDELVSMSMLEMIAPEYHELIRQRMQQRIDGASDLGVYSFEIIHKKGHRVWLELITNGVYDLNGKLRAIQGVARDISERKEAEKQLRESRRFLQTTLDMLPVGVFWKDLDLNFLGANKLFLENCGFSSQEDIVGHDDFFVNNSDENAEKYRADDRRVIETGEPLLHSEELFVSSSGDVMELMTSKMPLRTVDGTIFGILGTYVDVTQLKRLEEKSRRTQEQLQHIFDNSTDVIFQIDEHGNYVYANSAIYDLTGYTEEEILKMNIRQVVMPEYHEVLQKREDDRHGGAIIPDSFKFEMLRKDGGTRWGEVVSREVYSEDGVFEGVQGIVRDATERIQAEHQLQESKRFLQTIIDTIPARVFWKDLNSVYLGCNKSFAVDSGVGSSEDLIGKTDFDMSWAETEAELYRADDKSVMESGASRINYEECQTREDGARMWLSTSKLPIRDAGGEIVGVLGSYQDITDRKSLEADRILLSTAINQSAEAIVVMEVNGAIQYVNSAFEGLCGSEKENIVGGNISGLIKSSDAATLFGGIQGIINDDQLNGRLTIEAGESLRVHDVTVSPVRDSSGRVVHNVVTIRDVSRQVELEDHMRQAQKMDAVGRLAGGVAHDFNNILQSILGFSGMLLAELEEGTSQFDDVNEIRKAARRAGDLTRQLLTLSRKRHIEFSIQDINEIIHQNEGMMCRLIGEQIEFVFDLSDNLRPVRADVSQIEQILLNLFINARDAMREGGQLSVCTRNVQVAGEEGSEQEAPDGEDYICLCVSDSGVGIRDDVKEHLFEPFYTTKQVGEGTGLGLSVVYGNVKQHGGWIDVVSQVGEGAEFRIYIPASLSKKETVSTDDEIPSRKPESPEGRGEQVLVVEDDEMLRDLSVRMLTRAGYQVAGAENISDACEKLNEIQDGLHLLVSDIILPDGNGLEFAKTVRERYPNLAVLLCSGYSQDNEMFMEIRDYKFRYLEKPVATMLYLQTVREMLDEKA